MVTTMSEGADGRGSQEGASQEGASQEGGAGEESSGKESAGQEGGAGEESSSQEGGAGEESSSQEASAADTGETGPKEVDNESLVPNALGRFVSDEVTRAETDFDSYRSRSTAVIATSTSVVGLAGGLTALAASKTAAHWSEWSLFFLGLAIGCFVGAIVLGLLVHAPIDVQAADEAELKPLIDGHWDSSGWDRQIALMQVDYLKSLRKANGKFALLFLWSLVLQALGVIAVGALAVTIVSSVT